ncbi:hypothetical protein [Pelagicoccus sp. SDUM812003]|uniref:LolA family protein n=1 Tax=Pelagicoccus sp. SDUM812003 TaxID=3041267 RepID=UPI00280D1468|nr:hypothetical protein [Pelagicoccus sp. SDUM812003]MDQ8205612.1 hypothetical protein [Pelagicoccus sp. SDUM812003]
MKTSLTLLARIALVIGPLSFLSPARAELPAEVTDVLDRYLEASGGRERISELESTRLVGTISIPAMGVSGKSTFIEVYPDKMYSKQELPGMGVMLQVCDGDTGWAQDPMQGYRPLSEAEIISMKQSDGLRDLADFGDKYDQGRIDGEVEVNGEPALKLVLSNKVTGREETHYYGVESGLLLKKETVTDMGQMGEVPSTLVFLSYRDQDGFTFPDKMEVRSAMMSIEMTFSKFEIDPEIDPSIFEPPVAE